MEKTPSQTLWPACPKLGTTAMVRAAALLLVLPALAILSVVDPEVAKPAWDDGVVDGVDADLFRRAMVQIDDARLAEPRGKIAFLFLVRGPLPLQEIWHRFFQVTPVCLHVAPSFEVTRHSLSCPASELPLFKRAHCRASLSRNLPTMSPPLLHSVHSCQHSAALVRSHTPFRPPLPPPPITRVRPATPPMPLRAPPAGPRGAVLGVHPRVAARLRLRPRRQLRRLPRPPDSERAGEASAARWLEQRVSWRMPRRRALPAAPVGAETHGTLQHVVCVYFSPLGGAQEVCAAACAGGDVRCSACPSPPHSLLALGPWRATWQISWGGPNLIRAERRLLAAALADPANQRFVLLSESYDARPCPPCAPAPCALALAVAFSLAFSVLVCVHYCRAPLCHSAAHYRKPLQFTPLHSTPTPTPPLCFSPLPPPVARGGGRCVPLFNFSHVYDYLFAAPTSFITRCEAPPGGPRCQVGRVARWAALPGGPRCQVRGIIRCVASAFGDVRCIADGCTQQLQQVSRLPCSCLITPPLLPPPLFPSLPPPHTHPTSVRTRSHPSEWRYQPGMAPAVNRSQFRKGSQVRGARGGGLTGDVVGSQLHPDAPSGTFPAPSYRLLLCFPSLAHLRLSLSLSSTVCLLPPCPSFHHVPQPHSALSATLFSYRCCSAPAMCSSSPFALHPPPRISPSTSSHPNHPPPPPPQMLDPGGVEPRGVTFLHWQPTAGRHPLTITPEQLTPDFLRSVQRTRLPPKEAIGFLRVPAPRLCQLAGRPTHCFLFARKFNASTIPTLLALSPALGF
ncbi:unnamed protein product [Closterium sp. NIES-53]